MTLDPDSSRVCFIGEVINDMIALEGDEYFDLSLRDPQVDGINIGDRNRTVVIITDDDGEYGIN